VLQASSKNTFSEKLVGLRFLVAFGVAAGLGGKTLLGVMR